MNNQDSDDQIIAVVFRRTVFAVAVVAVIAALVFAGHYFSQQEDETLESAQPIAPQSIPESQSFEPPDVIFKEVSKELNLTHKHYSGAYGERLLPETMGGGVATFDFNNDSLIDVLLVNASDWPWREPSASSSSLSLYQGQSDGSFIDVTKSVGLNVSLYGMGVAVGDVDADGFADLFITAVGENRLFRNEEGASFEDVTDVAGVAGENSAWSTGASFLDHDRDGDLDLMVLNYVRWSREIDLQADYQLTGIGRAYGPPSQFAGTQSYFYENLGDGRFEERGDALGITVSNTATGNPVGKALALLPTDVNQDGWQDIVVANDTVRNFLFLNNQQGGFEEVGIEKGVAYDNTGSATGAMGIDGSLFAETGESAIAIGNFGNEMTSLYIGSDQQGLFSDQAVVTGIGPASRRAVTFGLLFLDYDLDGRMDLLQANGHIEPDINVVEPSQAYAQAPQLFWNCGADCPRQFIPVELKPENDLSQPVVGRGLVSTDIDGDGDLDLLLTQIDGPTRILRNEQTTGNNWIQLDLRLSSGASAYGAKVQLTSGDITQIQIVNPTRSYLSQVDPVLVFGLGTNKDVDQIQIDWPNGERQLISDSAINQRLAVIQEK